MLIFYYFCQYFDINFAAGSRNSPTENQTGNGAVSVPATVTGDALKLVPINSQASINIELPNTADLNDVTVSVTGVYNEKKMLKYQFNIV
jgi:hypothetical protein